MNPVNRKPMLWSLSILSIISLVSCGSTSSSSSASSSSSVSPTTSSTESTSASEESSSEASEETIESSSESSSSSSSVKSDQYIDVVLDKTTIPNGASFFDGCKPLVMYHDDTTGESEDVTEYTFKTEFKIYRDGESETAIGAGDALAPGHYTAKISHKGRKTYRTTVEFTVEEVTPIAASEGHGYKTYAIDELADTTFKALPALDTLDGYGMPTIGDVNILVIPVEFANATFDSVKGEKEGETGGEFVRAVLHEAFFAESEETPWESLHSYYKKASHGKLNIGGNVTPVYRYNRSDDDPTLSTNGLGASIAQSAVAWLKSECGYDMKDYDSDKDGYIDGVELVYATTRPTPSAAGDDGDSTWWNYTTNAGGSKNVNNPGIRRMFWSRWDYLTNNYYADDVDGDGNSIGHRVVIGTSKTAVDAHTIIHETGHMMGAPDYYSYDSDEGVAGCVDMMDNNVGDHNAYTKMGYGWAAPKVIDGSADNFTVTIRSWTDTGDFLLVRNTTEDPWNETPWDEYLILQYYTPTGVNEKDSTGYPEWQQATTSGSSAYGHGGTYEHPGLQVFHVDGRTASYQAEVENGIVGTKKLAYTDTPRASDFNDGTRYESSAQGMHTNTMNASGRQSRDLDDKGRPIVPTDVRELSIVLPSGTNSFKSSSYHTNFGNMSNLFGLSSYWGDPEARDANEKYGGTNYSNFKMRNYFPVHGLAFNDGSVNNWNWEVVGQTDEDVTIHFVNVA